MSEASRRAFGVWPILDPNPGVFTYKGVTYSVEQFEVADARVLPVRILLRRPPRGRRHLLVPEIRRPDRLFATSVPPHPFRSLWFAIEEGKLVIAPLDG